MGLNLAPEVNEGFLEDVVGIAVGHEDGSCMRHEVPLAVVVVVFHLRVVALHDGFDHAYVSQCLHFCTLMLAAG